MFFSGRFSYFWTLNQMEYDRHFNFNISYDFYSYEQEQYDYVVKYIWNCIQESLLYSFKNSLTQIDKEVSLRKIDQKVILWIQKEVVKEFKNLRQNFMNDHILNIGYQVRNLLVQSKERTKDNVFAMRNAKLKDVITYERVEVGDTGFPDTMYFKNNPTDLDAIAFDQLLKIDMVYIKTAKELV